MKSNKPQAKTAALFSNPVLERLTRTNALIAIGFYFVAGAAVLLADQIYNGVDTLRLAMLPAGLLTWTLVEYVLHRFIYHMEGESQAVQKFTYTMHGIHHDYPNDSERQVLPLVLAIPLALMFFSLFYFSMGIWGIAFFCGFLWGYGGYLYVHYSVHTQRMPKNWTRFFWKYHSVHHYREQDKAYGVSSPVWDFVFGTYPKGKYNW